MPYLFAITVVAFIALLWAAFSAARHIRRARRRRRLAAEASLEMTHTTIGAAALEPWLEPTLEAAPPPPAPEPVLAEPEVIRFPLSSHRMAAFSEPASDLPEATATPLAANNPLPATPFSVPRLRRPPLAPPDPAWGYIHKDSGGDLSDPTPRPRFNTPTPRYRERDSRHS